MKIDMKIWSRQFDPDYLIQTIWSMQFDPENLIQTIWSRLFDPDNFIQTVWSRLFDPDNLIRTIWSGYLIQTIWSRLFDPDNLIQTIWSRQFWISQSRWNNFTWFLSVAKAGLRIGCGSWNSNLKSHLITTDHTCFRLGRPFYRMEGYSTRGISFFPFFEKTYLRVLKCLNWRSCKTNALY